VNDKYDLEQAERQAKEKARLHIRLEKFSENGQRGERSTETTPANVHNSSEETSSNSEDMSPQSMIDAGNSTKKRKAAALRPSEEGPESGKVEKKRGQKG
jgi:exosome complex protein LRP1